MNREQWYKQRRLYRIKRLVVWSQGDCVEPKAWQNYEHFDKVIAKSTISAASAYGSPSSLLYVWRAAKRRIQTGADAVKVRHSVRLAMRANTRSDGRKPASETHPFYGYGVI